MTAQETFFRLSEILLKEKTPSIVIFEMYQKGELAEFPFSIFSRMEATPQPPEHHPEGNVLTHSLMVADRAAMVRDSSTSPLVFMWACLLHDAGKPFTTVIEADDISAPEHEISGAEVSANFLQFVTSDSNFIREISALIRWHMMVLRIDRQSEERIAEMMSEVNVRELALLGLCDLLGRGNPDMKKAGDTVDNFLQKCGLSR